MLQQVGAIIALKFALLRNTWSKHHLVSILIGAFLFCLLATVSAGAAIGMFALGRSWQWDAPIERLLIFDALILVFLMVWLWALLFELQRKDVIDFKTMLFFPISMRMIFVLNFASSLFSPALIIFFSGILGLLAGLSPRFPFVYWVLPLAAAFYLMVAAWTYYVRGKLGMLLENKRRRRLVMTLLPLTFALLGQLPNILIHSLRGVEVDKWFRHAVQQQHLVDNVLTAHKLIPFAWLPYGMAAAMAGDIAPALYGAAGFFLLTLLGLRIGYRSTIRHFTGETRAMRKAAAVSAIASIRPIGPIGPHRLPLTARRLPFLDDDTAACTQAAFLSFLRHPNIRMLMIMPLCMGLLFLFIWRSDMGYISQLSNPAPINTYGGNASPIPMPSPPRIPPGSPARVEGPEATPPGPPPSPYAARAAIMSNQQFSQSPFLHLFANTRGKSWIPAVILLWPFLNFSFVMFNIFGIDLGAFRGMILLPTPRHKYLLAKNLALFPFVGGTSLAFVLIGAFLLRSTPNVVAVSLLQILQLYLLFAILGNVLSIRYPYRIRGDSLRRGAGQPVQIFTGLLSMALVALVMVPTGFCLMLDGMLNAAWGRHSIPFGALLSLVLLAITIFVYRASLLHTGDMLLAQEKQILERLTRDRE